MVVCLVGVLCRLAAEEEGYANDGEDEGITMDIDDNLMVGSNVTGSYMQQYDDDDDDDILNTTGDRQYNYGNPNNPSGSNKMQSADWYLDDEDDDAKDALGGSDSNGNAGASNSGGNDSKAGTKKSAYGGKSKQRK